MEQSIKWDKTKNVLERYGKSLVGRYRDELAQNNRNASSRLTNTIKSEVKASETVISVELTLQDYWYYVEHGRKAGKMPPIKKIEKWIKDKHIPVSSSEETQQKKGKLKRKKRIKVSEKRHRLAFAIARKIAREGTKGTHSLQNASEETYNDFKTLLERAIAEDVGNYTAKIFREAF